MGPSSRLISCSATRLPNRQGSASQNLCEPTPVTKLFTKLIFHAESARVAMDSLRRRPGSGDEGRTLPQRSIGRAERSRGARRRSVHVGATRSPRTRRRRRGALASKRGRSRRRSARRAPPRARRSASRRSRTRFTRFAQRRVRQGVLDEGHALFTHRVDGVCRRFGRCRRDAVASCAPLLHGRAFARRTLRRLRRRPMHRHRRRRASMRFLLRSHLPAVRSLLHGCTRENVATSAASIAASTTN